jgi:hypothetical protein
MNVQLLNHSFNPDIPFMVMSMSDKVYLVVHSMLKPRTAAIIITNQNK